MLWVITIIEFLIGCILHFMYDIFPYFVVALIAPVNESIFEHLKLVLYPMLFVDLFLLIKYKNQKTYSLTSMLVGVLTGIMSVVLIYYFYRYGLGIENLIFDIILLFVGILIGNMMMIIVDRHHWNMNWYIILFIFIVLILLFSIWTFYSPSLPIFIDNSKAVLS